MVVISTYLTQPSGYDTEVNAIVIASLTSSTNDTVQLMTVQDGWVVTAVDVIYTGTAASTCSVGDGGSATRFINAASTATTGTLTSGAVFYKYVAGDTIIATMSGANVAAKPYTFLVKFMRTYN